MLCMLNKHPRPHGNSSVLASVASFPLSPQSISSGLLCPRGHLTMCRALSSNDLPTEGRATSLEAEVGVAGYHTSDITELSKWSPGMVGKWPAVSWLCCIPVLSKWQLN